MSQILQELNPNTAKRGPAAAAESNDLFVSASNKKSRTTTTTTQEEDLTKLTVKELKERCKNAGFRVKGNKQALLERLLHPEAALAEVSHKKRRSSMSAAAVHKALFAAGYEKPEKASHCVKRAIQRGHVSLEGGLDKVFGFTGKCDFCGSKMTCTLQSLLDQPDCGGHDYGGGSRYGALACENKDCSGKGFGKAYVTGLCQGEMKQDCGKFHNHCTECPGFGKCLGDYRETHCHECNKHFFAGSTDQFNCQHCEQKGNRGFGFLDAGFFF